MKALCKDLYASFKGFVHPALLNCYFGFRIFCGPDAVFIEIDFEVFLRIKNRHTMKSIVSFLFFSKIFGAIDAI